MEFIIGLLIKAITLYMIIIVISVILSLLINFRVINHRNELVYKVANILEKLTEPLLKPIRKRLPTPAGLDFSPLVLLLALAFIRDVVLAPNSTAERAILLLTFIQMLLGLVMSFVAISFVLSLLIAYDVVNRRNELVFLIANALYKLTDPLLRPLRGRLPNVGGFDISPIVLIVLLLLISYGFDYLIAAMAQSRLT